MIILLIFFILWLYLHMKPLESKHYDEQKEAELMMRERPIESTRDFYEDNLKTYLTILADTFPWKKATISVWDFMWDDPDEDGLWYAPGSDVSFTITISVWDETFTHTHWTMLIDPDQIFWRNDTTPVSSNFVAYWLWLLRDDKWYKKFVSSRDKVEMDHEKNLEKRRTKNKLSTLKDWIDN